MPPMQVVCLLTQQCTLDEKLARNLDGGPRSYYQRLAVTHNFAGPVHIDLRFGRS